VETGVAPSNMPTTTAAAPAHKLRRPAATNIIGPECVGWGTASFNNAARSVQTSRLKIWLEWKHPLPGRPRHRFVKRCVFAEDRRLLYLDTSIKTKFA
jgi:hypothetical protein